MLGEINFFLGLQITQSDEGIFIYQTKYINEMLKKFQMQDCKPVGTPMVTGCKLSQNDDSKNVEQKMYRSMIDNLLYVTSTRLDVMHAICQVARFRPLLKLLIYLQSKGSLDILSAQQNMVYGILRVINLICMLSLMLIGKAMLMT
jgi:hypothetical protein